MNKTRTRVEKLEGIVVDERIHLRRAVCRVREGLNRPNLLSFNLQFLTAGCYKMEFGAGSQQGINQLCTGLDEMFTVVQNN